MSHVFVIDKEKGNVIDIMVSLNEFEVYSEPPEIGCDLLLKRIAECYSDIILIDSYTAGLKDMAMIRKLKSDSILKNVPIIIMGDGPIVEEGKYLEAGANDFIIKPYSTVTLKLRINNILKLTELIKENMRLSMEDQLTKIPNRRGFEDKLNFLWYSSMREGFPLSLLFIDIDYFKKYNDKYGHNKGDICLKKVSNVIKSSLRRKSDFCSRWGGEEFAVLLYNTPSNEASFIAEKIRKNVESCVIDNIKGKDIKVTISVGVNTVVPTPTIPVEEFISNSDKALYQSKSNGRNRVTIYEKGAKIKCKKIKKFF